MPWNPQENNGAGVASEAMASEPTTPHYTLLHSAAAAQQLADAAGDSQDGVQGNHPGLARREIAPKTFRQEGATMKVGILGSGDVAQALGSGFLRHGHAVTLGTSSAAKLAAWQARNPGGRVAQFAEAAAFGETIVLAVKGTAAAEVLRSAGAAALAGKVVIDACNPIADGAPENGVLPFFTRPDESLLERLQAEFPKARLVKAFNSVGSALMVNPRFEGGNPTMFLCGNDAGARKTVADIIVQFGWEPADMGKAEAARAIEPLCRLWCIPGFLHDEWSHAFKLLRQGSPAPGS